MTKIIGYVLAVSLLVGCVVGGAAIGAFWLFGGGNWIGGSIVALLLLALLAWGRKGWKQ